MEDLEQRFAVAQERLRRASLALAPKHKGGEIEEFHAALSEVLSLERQLAAAKGEEYAETLNFPVKWDTGAPLPFLFMSDLKTFLTFYVSEPDPNWDGSYVTVKDPADKTVESLAVVEFHRCSSAKMGTPNDEVFEGHPLNGKGLEAYTAQVVRNSRWLASLQAINSVHSQYDPARWKDQKHFVFWFHDSTFECVAESYKVELFTGIMSELLSEVSRRLVD